MTPFDDFVYLINHVLLGEEPTIEDFILLVGTLVAFIAFILWCCFPIQPKEAGQHRQFTCKIIQSHIRAFDAPTPGTNDNSGAAASGSVNSGINNASGSSSNANSSNADTSNSGCTTSSSNNTRYNGSGTYSKNGSVAMHNYYVKSGHHCCT